MYKDCKRGSVIERVCVAGDALDPYSGGAKVLVVFLSSSGQILKKRLY
jgi:hypothetical protein